MIRERILFRLFFSLLLLLSFSPFCTYEPTSQIHPNGYMESMVELTRPPFDKPVSFIKLFDPKTRAALIDAIQQIRENAEVTAS